MTAGKAILCGAALIAVSILYIGTTQQATAGARIGPFQLMHHANPTANPGVFRLDTTTGEVSYCYISGSAGENAGLKCLAGVQ